MSSVVFGKDEETNSTPKVYRIPALFYNEEDQTLLAFAEQRTGEPDETAKYLVMKRGELKEKDSHEKMVEWGEIKVLEEAYMDGHRSMNPCPVYDKKNKRLFLFFICVEDCYSEQWQIDNYCNKACLCFIVSEDCGKTWSKVTDLTEQVPDDWVTLAVGPGHGVQTMSGRLIVPTYAYKGVKPQPHKKSQTPLPHSLCVYSDDYGQSWNLGKMLKTKSIECQMAEGFDGHKIFIYCNARSLGEYRVEGTSCNNGNSFKPSHDHKKLVETNENGCQGCQGSVVSFPAQNNAGEQSQTQNTWLLYSHPTSKSRRIDLGVYLNKSPSDLNAWSKPWVIQEGDSGYSDLAYLNDGWFACLMERMEEGFHCIALRLFQLSEIKD